MARPMNLADRRPPPLTATSGRCGSRSTPRAFMVTSHPDHVKSLFTARPVDAPSLTGESPLRPILGPNSVLTSVGARHMRQRKLLLPPSTARPSSGYMRDDREVAEREIDRWPVGKAVRAGAADAGDHARRDHERDFRDRGQPARGTPERRCGTRSGRLLRPLDDPAYQLSSCTTSAAVSRTDLDRFGSRPPALAVIARARADGAGEPHRRPLAAARGSRRGRQALTDQSCETS